MRQPCRFCFTESSLDGIIYYPAILRNWLSCSQFGMEARVLIAFSRKQYGRRFLKTAMYHLHLVIRPHKLQGRLENVFIRITRFSVSESFVVWKKDSIEIGVRGCC